MTGLEKEKLLIHVDEEILCKLVERRGFEPLTSWLPAKRSPN